MLEVFSHIKILSPLKVCFVSLMSVKKYKLLKTMWVIANVVYNIITIFIKLFILSLMKLKIIVGKTEYKTFFTCELLTVV